MHSPQDEPRGDTRRGPKQAEMAGPWKFGVRPPGTTGFSPVPTEGAGVAEEARAVTLSVRYVPYARIPFRGRLV